MPVPIAAVRGHWTVSSGVVTPWYLAGGIAAANCIAAFKAKGAANYAGSKVNLASGGATWDAVDGVAYPTWASATGWQFTAASSQYLVVGSAGIADQPMTFVCRFNPVAVDTNYALMAVQNQVGDFTRYVMFANGTVAGDPVQANASGAGSGSAYSTSGFTASNWFTACAVYINDASRGAFIDGANKGTDTTSAAVSSVTNTYIGARNSGSIGAFMNGYISACAFYNTNISDAQAAALHTAMAAL